MLWIFDAITESSQDVLFPSRIINDNRHLGKSSANSCQRVLGLGRKMKSQLQAWNASKKHHFSLPVWSQCLLVCSAPKTFSECLREPSPHPARCLQPSTTFSLLGIPAIIWKQFPKSEAYWECCARRARRALQGIRGVPRATVTYKDKQQRLELAAINSERSYGSWSWWSPSDMPS